MDRSPIRIGDFVTRKMYQHDVVFRVHRMEVHDSLALLRGKDIRLEVDASIEDLIKVDSDEREDSFEKDIHLCEKLFEYKKIWYEKNVIKDATQLSGRVLHVDGDIRYLRRSLFVYEKIGIPAIGIYQREGSMSLTIENLLQSYRPDVLVITGHDAHLKQNHHLEIHSHRNSIHFYNCVREVRKIIPNKDELVIFAGACQSHFESLLSAGSNFASSPTRSNIHALDPVFIVAAICLTPFQEIVPIRELISLTKSGIKGIGGIQCYGKSRICYPKLDSFFGTKNFLFHESDSEKYLIDKKN